MPSISPLFSIITVTYNAENTVAKTLRSVDEQTFRDYEHLMIDGASKDSTLQIINSYINENRHTVSEPDHGIYDAMNKGIGLAKGKYLIFLNAGDAFHSTETLAKIAQAATDNDYPGIIYGQTQLVDSDGNYIAPRHLSAPKYLTYKSFAQGMVVCHQAFVALARIAPLYDTKYRFSADYDWCIQCLQHSRKNIMIDGFMIDYLNEGITTANHKASLKERFKIMSYYYGLIPTIIRHINFLPRYLKRKSNNLKQ